MKIIGQCNAKPIMRLPMKTRLHFNHMNYDKHIHISHCISTNNFKDTSKKLKTKDTTVQVFPKMYRQSVETDTKPIQ